MKIDDIKIKAEVDEALKTGKSLFVEDKAQTTRNIIKAIEEARKPLLALVAVAEKVHPAGSMMGLLDSVMFVGKVEDTIAKTNISIDTIVLGLSVYLNSVLEYYSKDFEGGLEDFLAGKYTELDAMEIGEPVVDA